MLKKPVSRERESGTGLSVGDFNSQAVERKSLQLVKLLQKEYGPTLQRDPGIATELSAIEVKYCGAQVGQGMGGLFGGMLRSLLAAE